MEKGNSYLPIADYGIIGNLHTTALISKHGNIEYLPFTRFDSPTVFGSLLDKKNGGFFKIDVLNDNTNYKELYLPDTAVLITRYLTEDGIAEVTDYMPLPEHEKHFSLVRRLKGIKGEHKFRIEIKPAFNYGKSGTVIEKTVNGHLLKSSDANGCNIRVLDDIEFSIHDGSLIAEVTIKARDEINIVLEAFSGDHIKGREESMDYYLTQSFDHTVSFWRNWVSRSTYNGRWQDIVNRSAITLKLLTSLLYGSTVAAATFGLPESPGGDRNWDYRFTWIRDAAFTMYSFLQLGYSAEAGKFIDWILQRCSEIENADDLRLMYRVDGSTDLEEQELDNLEGYENSKPVRIGNQAFEQFQLDIYGELIDTIYIYNKNAEPITYEFWQNIMKFIDFVCDNWKMKDHGIWEVRGEQQEFLISKVMSWVALDRGILIAENRSFPAPLEKWRKARNEIYNDVYNNYWNPEKQAFVQYRGSDVLDASALLIPLVRMLSPKEPRWISTLRVIENELVTDSLVYRYRIGQGASDGFGDEEGTFSMCSFWYIECLAKSGEIDRAVLCFEKMLGYANHLGLFSEQISIKGELLGNFPQAFTHLGLISAAHQLKSLLQNVNI